MAEIFKWFENFKSDYSRKTPVDWTFPFPDLDNLGNSHRIKYWICSYITILFIRQYSLTRYYIYQDFTSSPTLPNEINELTDWLNSLPLFEKCFNDVVNNGALIEVLGYSRIIERNNEEFKTFFNKLKEQIEFKIGERKLKAPLSNEKIKNFFDKTNEILSKAFEKYNSIFGDFNGDYLESKLTLSLNGERTLVSKSTFTDNEIYTMDYDSFYASHIASNKIMYLIPLSFSLAKTNRYLISKNELTNALLKVIGNAKDYILIGVRIGFQVKEISNNSEFSNRITYIPSTQFQSEDTLYVLKKTDLPAIEHKDISVYEQKELQLNPINKDLKIYASIIDINKDENKEIKNKWKQQIDFDESELKVQIAISFLSEIYWKNNRKVVELNILSEYKEQGIQSDINEIEPLE